jgi:hypothetical protein
VTAWYFACPAHSDMIACLPIRVGVVGRRWITGVWARGLLITRSTWVSVFRHLQLQEKEVMGATKLVYDSGALAKHSVGCVRYKTTREVGDV